MGTRVSKSAQRDRRVEVEQWEHSEGDSLEVSPHQSPRQYPVRTGPWSEIQYDWVRMRPAH